jgi:L-phenylalanine/L-methionine N-acetyltransferase
MTRRALRPAKNACETMTPGPITIRRARASDADAFARLFAGESAFAGTLQMPYSTADVWRRRLESYEAQPNEHLVLVAEVGGEVVGNAGLHRQTGSPRRQHAASLGLVVDEPLRGRGVGRSLIAAVVDSADRWTGVLRIELTVFTDNARAIALYRHFGFEIEGTLRAYALHDGIYADALTMARLHPSPPRLPTVDR